MGIKKITGFSALFVIINVHLFIECRRVKRVVGGTEVDCGTAPYVVSLRNSSNSQHICGATLLSSQFALTAAHCVQYAIEEYFLQLNNFCIQDNELPPRASLIEIIMNELYDRHSRAHDIALLRIKLDINDVSWLNDSILPSNSFGISGECTLYGYGYKYPTTIETSDNLLAGKLKIVSLDECTQELGSYMAPNYNSGMMCAVGEGIDSCQGDSGSPLFCAGGWIQAISSYGLSCGIAGLPGVYTSVGAHLQWIQDVIENYKELNNNNCVTLILN